MKKLGYLSLLIGILFSCITHAGSVIDRAFSRVSIMSHQYSSDILARDYIIDVILPPNFNPTTGTTYPVIYILDGYGQFPMVGSNLYQEQLPDNDGVSNMSNAIIVGIEQPILQYDWQIRTLDMTPTAVEKNGMLLGGGADHFLSFLNEELKPFINARYSGDETDQTLLGHSLGGLFALYTLFSQPDSFHRYVIGSPTTWWDNDYIFNKEAQYAHNNDDLNKQVYLFIGGKETCNDQGELCGVRDVIKMTKKLKLRRYPNLNIKSKILKKENHHTVIAPGFDRGVEYVMKANINSIE